MAEKEPYFMLKMREFYEGYHKRDKQHPLYVAVESDSNFKIINFYDKKKFSGNLEEKVNVENPEKEHLTANVSSEELDAKESAKLAGVSLVKNVWKTVTDCRDKEEIFAEIIRSAKRLMSEGYNISVLVDQKPIFFNQN